MSDAPDNVVVLDCETRLDIPADRVLEGAMGELSVAVVLGYDHDGEIYFAASTANDEQMLMLVERFKLRLVLE